MRTTTFSFYSSKTFISINDLIDIIDLKLNQTTQFSIDKQKSQKSIYDFVRVFFAIFFFIKIAYQIFIQNARATMIKYNAKINRIISLFNIK